MDDLFNQVTTKIKNETGIDITGEDIRKDEFLKITKTVADVCLGLDPKPSQLDFENKVKDIAYKRFMKNLNPAPYPNKEPPFKDSFPVEQRPEEINIGIPKLELDKHMQLNQSTRPKTIINAKEKKVLVIDTGEFGDTDMPAETDRSLLSFSVNLQNKFQVPGKEGGQCEIYLESMIVCGTKSPSHDGTNVGVRSDQQFFIIGIDKFNIQSISNYTKLSNKIIIPNDNSKGTSATGNTNVSVLKSKKFNYISQMNTGETFSTLNFTCTDTTGSATIFNNTSGVNTNRICFEFMFIPL